MRICYIFRKKIKARLWKAIFYLKSDWINQGKIQYVWVPTDKYATVFTVK